MWREGASFNLRELENYVHALPADSWLHKHHGNLIFDYHDEMQAILIDLLRQNVHATSIAAAAMAGKDYRKAAAKAPKPFKRPTLRQEEKKPKTFVKTADLQKMLASKKVTIHHTQACIESKVNEGGQQLNCSCPRG